MADATPKEAATTGGGIDGTALVWTVVFLFVVAFCCGACACHELKKRMKPKRRYSDDEFDEGRGSGHHYSIFGPRYGNPSHSHETPGHAQKPPTNQHEIDLRNQELEHKQALHEKQKEHDTYIYRQEVAHKEALLAHREAEFERSQHEKDRNPTAHHIPGFAPTETAQPRTTQSFVSSHRLQPSYQTGGGILVPYGAHRGSHYS